LAIEVKVNPGCVNLAEYADKILQSVAEPVNRPRGDDIKLVAHDRLVQWSKSRRLSPPLAPETPSSQNLAITCQPRRSHASVSSRRWVVNRLQR
jgi:hypothetical protein